MQGRYVYIRTFDSTSLYTIIYIFNLIKNTKKTNLNDSKKIFNFKTIIYMYTYLIVFFFSENIQIIMITPICL